MAAFSLIPDRLAHIHVRATQPDAREQLITYMQAEGFHLVHGKQKGARNAPEERRLFLLTPERQGWVGVFEDEHSVDAALAKFLSENMETRTIRSEPTGKGINALTVRDHGEVADADAKKHRAMTDAEVTQFLTDAGVPADVLTVTHQAFHAHDAGEPPAGFLRLTFTRPKKLDEKAVVARILTGAAPSAEATTPTLTLDQFIAAVLGNVRIRPLVKNQMLRQLAHDGIDPARIRFSTPEPEGHFCQRYDTESYSFTSTGPYIWFDWECEEACEPGAGEHAPTCDLSFELQKSEE